MTSSSAEEEELTLALLKKSDLRIKRKGIFLEYKVIHNYQIGIYKIPLKSQY
jgi:hypothetical protein